ncbi:MAG TPA: hypothetical protein VLW06_15420 [Terriglobales bacterium]|nr:hypothetical protein [Terriglobales bacterium]
MKGSSDDVRAHFPGSVRDMQRGLFHLFPAHDVARDKKGDGQTAHDEIPPILKSQNTSISPAKADR